MVNRDIFAARMSELDALVAQCHGYPPFADGTVRDTSNRSGRDWPWWSVEIDRTLQGARDTSRISATIRLNASLTGEPGSFEGQWQARIWQGVSADSFRATGGWPLAWEQPTAQEIQQAMIGLLDAASAAMAEKSRPQSRAT